MQTDGVDDYVMLPSPSYPLSRISITFFFHRFQDGADFAQLSEWVAIHVDTLSEGEAQLFNAFARTEMYYVMWRVT